MPSELNSSAIRGQVQPSDGQVVIYAPYDVGGREVVPT